jgi:signal transduction histidine kinase
MSDSQADPWIILTLLSAASLAVLSGYLWRRRTVRGARPLAAAMLIMTAWCVAYAAQLAASDAAARASWFLVGDALTVPAAAVSVWFALEYAGLERWLTRAWAALLGASVVVLLAGYVVDAGRLVWSDLWTDGPVHGDLAPLGVLISVYVFMLAATATGVFIVLFVRSPAHRAPVALILVGHVSLRIAFLFEALNLSLAPGVPITVLAVDLTALMYAIALFRFRLFDLLPIARATMVERMPDGLLVLDTEDRVVDLNAAAQQLLRVSLQPHGRVPVATLLAPYPVLLARLRATDPGPSEASLETPGGHRVIEVTGTPLTDWRQRRIGRLVLLHDITALRAVEAQLVDRERALAVAQERTRMARELHDGLAQDLWLAKLKATRLAELPELGAEARALGEEIAAVVDLGIAEARQVVAALRGPDTKRGSLRELLASSLEDFEDRFGLAVEWECPEALPALPARAEVETLRIVGEALTNVRRHADATVVRVRAGVDDGQLILEVRDNGHGFDPTAPGNGGFGVAGMRERAAQIGARLEIDSAPRRGTRVRLGVPVALSTAVEAGTG